MLGEVKIHDQFIQFCFLSLITSESVTALILTLQSSALMSSSHLSLSGNFAKARVHFKMSDQSMNSLPHGLLPLTIWENMMLLGLWMASILTNFAAHGNVRLTRTTRRGSIPKVSSIGCSHSYNFIYIRSNIQHIPIIDISYSLAEMLCRHTCL